MMIYKHDLWNLPTKITFFFFLTYLFNVLFYIKILSYFAKPNFIIYDEWFDDDLEITKLNEKNKEIKTTPKIHDFFYEQSNYKVGASENNFQLGIQVNKNKFFNNNYLGNTSEKLTSFSNKKFRAFEKHYKSNLKFNLTKKIIYPLSIFGFVFILGFILFFISQSKKDESKITNKPINLERGF